MPDDEYEDRFTLSEEELILIQDESRREQLKQTLIGPIVSTLAHIIVLVLCAVFFQGEVVRRQRLVKME